MSTLADPKKNIPPKNIPCWNWNLCYFKHHFLPHPPATKKKSRYARPPKNHTQYIRSSRPSLEPIHEGAFVFFPRSLGFTLTLLWSKSKVYSRSVFLEPAIHEPVEDEFFVNPTVEGWRHGSYYGFFVLSRKYIERREAIYIYNYITVKMFSWDLRPCWDWFTEKAIVL